MTPADADQGDAVPISKPGLPSFWPGEHPAPPPPPMVKVNVAEQETEPPEPVAVAVTLYVPAALGVPEAVPVVEQSTRGPGSRSRTTCTAPYHHWR